MRIPVTVGTSLNNLDWKSPLLECLMIHENVLFGSESALISRFQFKLSWCNLMTTIEVIVKRRTSTVIVALSWLMSTTKIYQINTASGLYHYHDNQFLHWKNSNPLFFLLKLSFFTTNVPYWRQTHDQPRNTILKWYGSQNKWESERLENRKSAIFSFTVFINHVAYSLLCVRVCARAPAIHAYVGHFLLQYIRYIRR